MRIDEFAPRETPRPAHARLFRNIITFMVGTFGTLSLVSLLLGIGKDWPEWSYAAWSGALVGSILFLVMRRVGRSPLLGFLTTTGWGIALMSLGMLLITRHTWNVFMVLGWLLPAMTLLIYCMSVGIDLDALFYGDGMRPAQFHALGNSDRHIDPLQNPSERDIPAQRH